MTRDKYLFVLLFFLFVGHWIVSPKSFPKEQLEKHIVLVGQIAGIPKPNRLGSRFLFQTSVGTLQLSWYQHKKIPHAGERWRFLVKLKAIHGLHNPGGFNAERWAKMQGIVASGYVVHSDQNAMLSRPRFSITAFRERIENQIRQHVRSRTLGSIIDALSIGSKKLIVP